MKKYQTVTGTALVLGLLVIALAACDKGPAEKAGENIDDAVERAGDSLERTGDRIRDAGRDARE
ncbi:hypothetical protein [Ectothiorhodospira sp. BSL-9]|uniref:hypothetical protein n=1 Tax=Ectothiorhodospira sp. BSL-9 TaxID=1442136 RepID=UPI0007B446EF|nr:hypothetical protein [Ectothiorhodospira sp. BSL-9]ANB02364.1 hypothetical protein ECTOBSL9_1734 [Ectothiorhodospira sp. BSL-9]